MKDYLNAGAIALGLLTLVACSSSDRTDPAPASPSAPPATEHAPKLSLVHSPAAVAAAKNLSLGGSSGGGAHTLSAGAPGTCGLTSGDPTCDTCITNTCCTEGAACNSDPDCVALINCYDACTDDSCFSTCDTAHRPGSITLGTFTTCIENSCATDCGGPPPSSGGACGGVTSGDPTCDACLTTTCCSDVTSCINDADCTDLMDCLNSCTDATCESTCETAHPAGTAELTSLSSCVDNNCSACTGGSSPPPPTPPPPGAPSCGLSSGDGTCDACLDASCCTESETCVRDTDCNALLVCLDACTDDTCATACAAAHPSGEALLDSVVSCLSTSCSTTCF